MARLIPMLAVAVCLASAPAAAADPPDAVPAVPRPLDGLPANLARAFLGPNFAFHLAAVAATATMTTQDLDLRVRDYFHDHERWGRAAYPVVILGGAGPVLLFAGVHGVARWTGDRETLGAAFAVTQAIGATLAYVTVLKLVTGRPAPRDDYVPGIAPDMAQLSRTFRPGIYRGGVVAGWPSGHVAVTTAMLASLATYYPRNPWLKIALVLGTATMMLGVSSFDAAGMHWASDALAGALMAMPIGFETGRGMRRLIAGESSPQTSAWFVSPSLLPGTTGALVGRSF